MPFPPDPHVKRSFPLSRCHFSNAFFDVSQVIFLKIAVESIEASNQVTACPADLKFSGAFLDLFRCPFVCHFSEFLSA